MTAVVCHYTDASVVGGAEAVLVTLVARLDRSRWRPVVLCRDETGVAPLRSALAELGVNCLSVSPMPEGGRGLRALPGLVRTLRALRPQVLHAHLSWPIDAKFALAGARAARVPAIVATCHSFFDIPMGPVRTAQQWAVARGVDAYIAVSRHVADRVRETMPWPADRIEVITNGIDADAFVRERSESLRRRLTDGDPRPVVLTIGRLDDLKGHVHLLAAAREVPEAFFLISGEGPARAMLERRVSELGIGERVRFLGRYPSVPDLLACADLFALPSLSEGLPLAVLEAMAAGLPVVASAIGGTDEVVDDGTTGLLVRPADANALGGAIRRVLGDADLAQRLGAAGRTRVEREFSADVMTRRTEEVYARVLRG